MDAGTAAGIVAALRMASFDGVAATVPTAFVFSSDGQVAVAHMADGRDPRDVMSELGRRLAAAGVVAEVAAYSGVAEVVDVRAGRSSDAVVTVAMDSMMSLAYVEQDVLPDGSLGGPSYAIEGPEIGELPVPRAFWEGYGPGGAAAN